MPTGDFTAERAAGDDARLEAPVFDDRQVAVKMLERGRDFFLAFRKRDPALDAEHLLARGAHTPGVRSECAMPLPGGHQVHRAGRDLLLLPSLSRCMMRAVEQIGDGGEPDMRMRPHVHALPGDELHRPHLIEEDEGADHLPLAVGQRAAHGEAVAEIAHARHDDEIERVAGALVAENRIVPRGSSSCADD
jgi:hypothetical protein